MIALLLLAWVGAKLSAPWWYWCLLGVGLLIGITRISISFSKTANKLNGGD